MHILASKTTLDTEGSVSSTSHPPRFSFSTSQFPSCKTGGTTHTHCRMKGFGKAHRSMSASKCLRPMQGAQGMESRAP